MRIPGVTSTGSKRPGALFGTESDVPLRVARASGCMVWDEAGRPYVDMIMGLGAVALGYGHPAVVGAAAEALEAGVTGPLPPLLEDEVAERLCAAIPGAESVRFLKTGAEAVAAAVRIARVQTGRDRVVTCGYHGWLDWCQGEAGVPHAVRELRTEITFGDVPQLESATSAGENVAAIVVEPVVDGPPPQQWLEAMRARATAIGAVLVFDEIKTAFRIALGGAAERWGVLPDLIVVGKALGNGFPIAAVTGGRDLMNAACETWISSTLATESVSLAAAKAVLDTYDREPVIEHLRSIGQKLFEGLRARAERFPDVVTAARGMPQMCYLEFRTPELSTAVAQAAARQGLLLKRTAYNYVSLAHSEETLTSVFDRLDRAMEGIAGTC
jgi:glutamate-1-semialdehyde 2,1-aminomutase